MIESWAFDNNERKIHYYGRDLEAMSFAKNYYTWLIDEVSSFLGDYVAEIGAGQGNFSSFLLNTGIKRLIAFEPSENMFPILQRRFQNEDRIQVFNTYLHDYPGGGPEPFETAIYINVLEHVADDVKELALIHSHLKTRGHVILLVPALSTLYNPYPCGKLWERVGAYVSRGPCRRQFFTVRMINDWDIIVVITGANLRTKQPLPDSQ